MTDRAPWPTSCPKCEHPGETILVNDDPTFQVVGPRFEIRYCEGLCEKHGWSTGTEHLHHRCGNCGFEVITHCADWKGEEK